MIKPLSQNFRFIILLLIAAVIIIIEMDKVRTVFYNMFNKPTIRQRVDNLSFYNKEFPLTKLISARGDTFKLPDNRNHIIIGLNKRFDRDIDIYGPEIQAIDTAKYSIDGIIITLEKFKYNMKYPFIYRYDDTVLGEFFKLGTNSDFIIVLEKDNRIKFFLYIPPKINELNLLIEKYKLSAQ
jgi:hypothetical protein